MKKLIAFIAILTISCASQASETQAEFLKRKVAECYIEADQAATTGLFAAASGLIYLPSILVTVPATVTYNEQILDKCKQYDRLFALTFKL